MFHVIQTKYPLLVSSECRKLASVKRVSIGAGNDLSPIWHQAITWTNADLFSESWI